MTCLSDENKEVREVSYSHFLLVKNGDAYSKINKFICDCCQGEICESDRYFEENNTHLCIECAYLRGKISGEEYLISSGFSSDLFGVEIIDGKPVVYMGKKPSERKNKDYRSNKKYKEWRKAVFERDSYVCQHCFAKGGELNAHHIKTFKDFVELRYEVSNGLTLCLKCHREVHKKRR